MLQKYDIGNTSNVRKLLRDVDLMFFDIEKKAEKGFAPSLNNKIFSAINFLTQRVIAAEKQGLNKDDIRAELPNAWRIHSESSFTKYAQDWPRDDIQGDYNIINMLMDKKEDADLNSIGGIIGRYALDCDITEQHRNKVKIQAEHIKKVCKKVKGAVILSIACGSARDVELAQKEIKESGAKIFLVDFDQEALNDAVSRLRSIENQLETFCIDVRQLPRIVKKLSEDNSEKKDGRIVKQYKFDLIYMGGLFDYLSTKFIKLILKNISNEFMGENGKLLFTNIAEGNQYRVWMETLVNWVLIERSEKEMRELLSATNMNYKKTELYRDPTYLAWVAVVSR